MRKWTDEQRAQFALIFKGKPKSAEQKEKMRLAKLGKKKSPEHAAKLADHLRSLPPRKHTPETAKRISTTLRQYYQDNPRPPMSNESKQKLSASIKQSWAKRKALKQQ